MRSGCRRDCCRGSRPGLRDQLEMGSPARHGRHFEGSIGDGEFGCERSDCSGSDSVGTSCSRHMRERCSRRVLEKPSILPLSMEVVWAATPWSTLGTTSAAWLSGIVVPLGSTPVVAPSHGVARVLAAHSAPSTLSKLWFSWKKNTMCLIGVLPGEGDGEGAGSWVWALVLALASALRWALPLELRVAVGVGVGGGDPLSRKVTMTPVHATEELSLAE